MSVVHNEVLTGKWRFSYRINLICIQFEISNRDHAQSDIVLFDFDSVPETEIKVRGFLLVMIYLPSQLISLLTPQ